MTLNAATNSAIYNGLERSAVKAADWLNDLVFPPTCGNCGRVDARFCAICRGKLAHCPEDITYYSVDPLDGLCATGKQQGLLASAVKAFKYEDATNLRDLLADRLIIALSAQAWSFDTVVPVPLHTDRLLERGYNQSELLAERLAQTLRIRFEPSLLRRIRSTGQQARLSVSERAQNVAGAFEADRAAQDLSILLIDDVVTTGETLSACAKALRAQQAEAVYGIAVSHA